VMNGTPPPPSQWPTLRELRNGKLVGDDDDRDDHDAEDERGKEDEKHRHSRWQPTLVDATKAAMGFPSGVPGIPDSIFLPENFIFPVFDYDWGPLYNHSEANGVPTNMPPPIRHVIKMLVPRVDADGNELGGVPTVQVMAPLATYLGWNITAGPSDGVSVYDGRPFHAGQVCNYVGGMVPFFKTKAQRQAAGDPRLSLEERYVDHKGYVAAVKAAANTAACRGYLNAGSSAASMGAKCTTPLAPGVADDWAALVQQAADSDVLCNTFVTVGTPPVTKCADPSGL
jgi:Alpha/beta hydrolase domain